MSRVLETDDGRHDGSSVELQKPPSSVGAPASLHWRGHTGRSNSTTYATSKKRWRHLNPGSTPLYASPGPAPRTCVPCNQRDPGAGRPWHRATSPRGMNTPAFFLKKLVASTTVVSFVSSSARVVRRATRWDLGRVASIYFRYLSHTASTTLVTRQSNLRDRGLPSSPYRPLSIPLPNPTVLRKPICLGLNFRLRCLFLSATPVVPSIALPPPCFMPGQVAAGMTRRRRPAISQAVPSGCPVCDTCIQ